ncbi:MAG: molybdopterin-dependent oxidoreductase [Peptococcaceae bacterium]|nr:molybdopterin-dependent oxidoreductase [Peptococcaceae bacterium]
MKTELYRSVCPFDCPDTCGLLVEIRQGKVNKVMGDPEHPHTKGTLCPKMNQYEKTVYSPERLTQPLLRSGPKGSGSFKPISWEEALNIIVERWQQIIDEYTAEAILPYSYAGVMGMVQRNCGEAFFHRLGASRLKRTICATAKTSGWKLVMGETLPAHPAEVLQSDFIIMWGTNALATNIHMYNNIRQAKKQGAKVWLIDTYETPSAQIADKVLISKPGRDGALALGLMHIIARDNLVDKEFITAKIQGYEELATKVLPNYPPAKVSAITGVDPSVLEELAHQYAKAKAPFITLGTGLSRYGNGAMTVRSITCLPALVGAWAKPGGGLVVNAPTGKAFNNDIITRPDFMSKPTRVVNMNQLGSALTELSDPPVMALYVYHSNQAIVTPNQNKILKGLQRDDLFCVVHERFLTDTALYADLLLPATSSLEQPDLYRSYGQYVIQKTSAIISPIGEAKSNWEVFQLLAERLGFTEPYFKQTAEQLVDQVIDQATDWLKKVDLAALKQGQPVELPLPANYKTTYQTPSGKIEILNPADPEPLPGYCEPHSDNAPFHLVSSPSLYSLNSSFNERKDLVSKKKGVYLMINPLDAQAKNLSDNQHVVAFNQQGRAEFILQITPQVPQGVVVTEGLFWLRDALGERTVNALTSERLTDRGEASTLYDVKVDLEPFQPA